FFEDFAVRDLSVYAESLGAELKHYRDSLGLEVDTIVKMPNGDYGAVEIKIASEKNIKEGINSLNIFNNRLLSSGLKLPAFRMILTSHGVCRKTEEGIYIVPINLLRD
ncbi:MAG: hypothetical protein II721_01255, partial [Bacilli bacterium]|nr:hypothetical protein [Bacilli bacterium]